MLLPRVVDSAHHVSGKDSHRIQFERESLYGWVRVIDKPAENFRLLTVDASTIGAATISHGENVLTYQKIVDILPALIPQINRTLLIGQGLLALNFVAFLEDGKKKALASVAKTLAQVFPHQQVFISEPDTEFNDFIFLAAHQAIEYDNGVIPAEQRNWLKARRITIDQSPGTVLTDNLNPLEMLQIRKSEQYRRLIVELLGIDHFIR